MIYLDTSGCKEGNQFLEISTCREGLISSAGQYRHPEVRIVPEFHPYLSEPLQALRIDGIHCLGTVKLDQGNMSLFLDENPSHVRTSYYAKSTLYALYIENLPEDQ